LAGGDAWITKPFRANQLLAKLEQVLSGRQPPGAGRRVLAAGPPRVIAAATGPRAVLLQQACNVASCWLEAETTLEAALARADRETFDLLVCEYLPGSDVVGMVKAFLEHFALNLPALFLLERATGRTTAGGPMHALLLPVTPHELAARMDEILRGQAA
jgi:DNA-binding response OmpR family regulator